MADEFKTFDKVPIVEPVRIHKWAFGLREMILAAVCLFLLIMTIVFACLYASAEHDCSSSCSTAKASAIMQQSYCETKGCLKTAARSVELMNKSVNPCHNFYQYACGNYINARPLGPNRGTRTVFSDIFEANEDKLDEIMTQPVDRMKDWAAERKLKEFFQSCTDTYAREKLKGKPFLEKVVTAMGGWHLLGNWDQSSWDFNTALKKAQTDFWVDALYSPRVQMDFYNLRRRVIELEPAGVGKWMFYSWYLSPYTEQYRQDYRKFIYRVGELFLRDSGIQINDTLKENRLSTFVNDTMAVETMIAHTAQYSSYEEDPYLEINKVSLADLTTQTNNVINWVDQLSYLFQGAGITGNTNVVVLRREYFRNITAMISTLPAEHKDRMLHNYLIWRVAEVYVQDLSWDYIHANREIYVDVRGTANFMGVYNYCFSTLRGYMPDALSSLFIADHFTDENRRTVTAITSHLKTALQEQLDKTPWFDEATRKYAKDKLDLVTFKMGYPEWMNNHDAVDQIYNGVTINASDFFQNLMSVNMYHRTVWSAELRNGENRQQWLYDTFETNIAVMWMWNEVIAPAGILQSPIYDSDQPHSISFGSFGALAARMLHHIVDDWGKHYDKFGKFLGNDASFWSNASIVKYEKAKTCVDKLYTTVSENFTYPSGDVLPVLVDPHYNTPKSIAITSGVRLALIGYTKWARDRGLVEKLVPGLSMTNQQMTMLSWAQSECSNRNAFAAFYNALDGNLEEEIMVNTALGELKEFSDAFNCKPEDKMNHAQRCDYY